MENNEEYTKIEKEKENFDLNKINKNKIINLKKELSSKDELILKLQKELELNTLKNDLNSINFLPRKNSISINSLNQCQSNKILNDNLDLLSNKAYSTNKSKSTYKNGHMGVEDIQNQISELNLQLKEKKNLLKKIKNENIEMKSKTCTNWKIKDSDIVIEELKEKIIKYEEEKNVFT